ncbi:hypothetical protein DXT76_21135 [Halobacillus trueperi]|uniref:Uncharacterized protein n=1 Tax=Halobacillus trueperi TaxID=156205 RepID=A0A3D8VBM9_9BACI|nr:hypothetical protein DXT76_21135 [Halobacillus trueperi]
MGQEFFCPSKKVKNILEIGFTFRKTSYIISSVRKISQKARSENMKNWMTQNQNNFIPSTCAEIRI